MKKLTIIFLSVLMLILLATSVYAINFCLDYLEAGGSCDSVNPVALNPGNTFSIDILLAEVPETLITSGFLMDYSPSKLSLVSMEVYDGQEISPATWNVESCKDPEALGPGSYWLFLINLGGGAYGNPIHLAKATFECIALGETDITFWPSYDEGFLATVTQGGFVYDTEIDPTTIHINIGNVIDSDGDGVFDEEDNCPNMPNGPLGGTCTAGDFCKVTQCNSAFNCGVGGYCSMNQEDNDSDGMGDACEFCEGDFDCDLNVDGSDAALFRQHFGRNNLKNPCTNASPCKGDFNCDRDVDGKDAAVFKADFGRGLFYNVCRSCVICTWCVYGLVSYWRFDEGQGTTAFDSVDGNNGTLNGTTWTTGKVNGALSFDGTNDYVEVSDDPSLDLTMGLTISVWVKVNVTTGDHQIIVAKWYYGPFAYVLELQPDGMTPQFATAINENIQYVVSNTQVAIDVWEHLAATYDGHVK